MIYAFKNKIPSGFLVTTYHRQADKPVIFNRFTSDETRADNLIRQVKKEVLQEKLSKYLNHRKTLMENYGALSTDQKYRNIQTIQANLSMRKNSSIESNCRLVIDYSEMLKSLLPGESSIYYKGAKETISEIISFCKLELKITL